MIQGTTPDYTLVLNGYDLTGKRAYVTVSQGAVVITKTNEDINIIVDQSGDTVCSMIEFSLTQQETLSLNVGIASVQVKMINESGHVDGTRDGNIRVDKALLKRVITYEPAGGTS